MEKVTRRGFARAAAAPALFTSRAKAQDRPPNILWISAEDLSPDLGCYGDSYAHTPNLDKFAAQGMRYTRAFTVAGVCAPSRSSIITGMYPSSIGTHHMRSKGVPPPYVKCFPEYLRAAGYYCSNNVKTDYNFDPPVTAWDESSNKAHWRNRRDKSQPFFAVFNHTVTHESQARPTPEQLAQNRRDFKPGDARDPAKAVLPPYYPDTEVVRKNWATNYDNITALDYQIQRLLNQLEADGEASNTVVMFWGDHGRGLTRGKRWLYDSGIHIPLMIRWPGKLAAGSVNGDLVSAIDFAPTLLSIAGIDIPRHFQGQAFLGDRKAPPRQYVYGIRDRMDETSDCFRAVRDARYKYIRNYQWQKPYAQPIDYMDQMPILREMRRLHQEGKLNAAQALWFAPEKPQEELYDTDADPHEIANLAAKPEHRATLHRLRAAHEQWRRDTGDLGLIPEPELLERMRPGGEWSKTATPEIDFPNGKLRITCATEGASIAWTAEAGPDARWQLYSVHSRAPQQASRIRAKACRLGWHDSDEAVVPLGVA